LIFKWIKTIIFEKIINSYIPYNKIILWRESFLGYL